MLPSAATVSSSSSSFSATASPPLHASLRAAPSLRHLSPPLPPLLSAGSQALPRTILSRGGDVFWEEPDDGSGSEDEDKGKGKGPTELRRSSPFPSPFPFSRLAAARQQEQQEWELRRELELLLTPEEMAVLDQNEILDATRISSPKWHPLHTCALALQIPLMDKLLDSGIDINLVHKDGATPLHYAVQVGALQTVKLLIKYNVDVDGWTPLHLAIQSRNRDIAKILLVNGADQTRTKLLES